MATRQDGNVNVTRQGTTKDPSRGSALARSEPSRGSASLARPMERGGSPFTAMRRLMDDMERSFFGRPMTSLLSLFDTMGEPLMTGSDWMPQLEIFENDQRLTIRADLPGLKPEDVRVQVEDGVLTLSGERKLEHEEEKNGVFHSERRYGSFQRSVALPEGVNQDAIEAKFENGVIEITMPSPERKERGKQIEVKSTSSEAKKS